MSQPSDAPRPPSLATSIDPRTIQAATYPRMLLGFLAVWCFFGILLTFFGSGLGSAALWDTLGLVITAAEALFILARDRRGFYSGAGYFHVDEWNAAQRALLAIAEIPGFFLMLILYVVRVVMKQYLLDQEPAPLAPPARRRPSKRS